VKSLLLYDQDFLTFSTDEDLILKESISRILVTQPGERVNNPFFGSKLRSFLFYFESVLREDVISEINNAVSRWEPRIKIQDIRIVFEDGNRFVVKVYAEKVNTFEEFTYEQAFRY